MPRLLHLDPIGGAAGDMFLGTLAALGLDPSLVTGLPERLGMPHVSVRFESVMRGALAATHAIVEVGAREEKGHGRHLPQVLELVDRAIPRPERAGGERGEGPHLVLLTRRPRECARLHLELAHCGIEGRTHLRRTLIAVGRVLRQQLEDQLVDR